MFIDTLSNFRYKRANDFLVKIIDELVDYNLYLFLSKTNPWNDDSLPDEVKFSLDDELAAWDEMSALKKIVPSDITLGIARYNWVRDTVYDEYSNGVNLKGKQYYILTSQNNLYKCISNNGGQPSTVVPSHVTEDIIEEADGYKWKFMLTVSTSLLQKFSLNDFIPLPNDHPIVSNSTERTIDNIKLIAGGLGYTPNASADAGTQLSIFIEGDGDQTSAATATINTIDGAISSVDLVDGATGYLYAPQINFPVAFRQMGPQGVNQSAYGWASADPDGVLLSAEVVIGGADYDPEQTVQIIQSSCEGLCETNSAGVITSASVFAGRTGDNFNKVPRAIVISKNGSGAELLPVLSPLGGHGSNIYEELNADYVLINAPLKLLLDNDILNASKFRRIGLILNPVDSADDFITDTLVDAKYSLLLDGTNENFLENEMIYGVTSGAIGKHVNKYEDDTIRVIPDDSISNNIMFEEGEQIRGLQSDAVGFIDTITIPGVKKYTGDFIHINNIRPINDSNLSLFQFVSINFILEF